MRKITVLIEGTAKTKLSKDYSNLYRLSSFQKGDRFFRIITLIQRATKSRTIRRRKLLKMAIGLLI